MEIRFLGSFSRMAYRRLMLSGEISSLKVVEPLHICRYSSVMLLALNGTVP